MNSCPPTVIVPRRDVRPVFAAIANDTAPLPVPLAPPVIVSQVAGVLAFQLHESAAATEIVPLEASAGALTEFGEMSVLQVPDWVMVNVRPAIVMAAVRAVVAVFARTEYDRPALPEPLAGEVS
jgi:hypothetical protein